MGGGVLVQDDVPRRRPAAWRRLLPLLSVISTDAAVASINGETGGVENVE